MKEEKKNNGKRQAGDKISREEQNRKKLFMALLRSLWQWLSESKAKPLYSHIIIIIICPDMYVLVDIVCCSHM